ncbi:MULTISPECIES: iron ABC transporter permease [unclassified Luteimonas]|uniref:ABC transporter permease n=1 Tax=unclassified Luteimonas TaxID=2629088 RepID=UPI00160487C2|nr:MULTISPECIES: iron ABC transporter permease [unclassified Luteimonas]MBB1472163.1 iron ABC transporter permease [Luteimonas sp. MC1782]MBB6599110.1 iron ABC transporter permease [Luteimonas sp. MC1825]QOC89236.1 iron ABC transporter permease [Luteimonas sp. MC1825]
MTLHANRGAAAALRRLDPWQLAAAGIAAVVLLPLLSLAWTALQGSAGMWSHVAVHVLPTAARNTLLLLGGVGVLVVAIGTGAAWLVTAYDFPGRRTLAWALLLPLAVPTYIVAFAYLDLLHPLGPVQGVVRALLGYDSPRDFRLPDIRSLAGCIVLLGFVLYPYVYLTTRAMFMTQAAGLIEAARTLGASPAAVFRRVALPLARPAIAVGTALALMEALNDIGASEFLGVQTLTVAVYTTWITRSDLPGAAQIALSMLVVVVALLALERHARRRQRYASGQRPRPMQPLRLRGGRAVLAFSLALLPVVVGFVLPAAYLVVETLARMGNGGVSPQLLASTRNTVLVAVAATLATVFAGLVMAWALRLAQGRRREASAALRLRAASLGYAVPGTVLAIGLLMPLAWFDDGANLALRALGMEPRMLLMGSMAALVLVYLLRFLAIAAGGIESGLARIPPSLDQAAASLGHRAGATLRRVHLPLLRPSLAAAALLVFVDAMKELSATLLLRPLDFETLATWLYAEASRGTYEEGAVAALLIVLVGLLPVVLLARTGLRFGQERAS